MPAPDAPQIKFQPLRINAPGYGPKIVPAVTTVDLSAQICLFTGAGAPTVATLLAGNGKYILNDLYLDTTANALYRCTAAGTNAAATWVKITSAGSSSITAYDSGVTYSQGSQVWVDQNNTALGNVRAWPGMWMAIAAVPLPSQPAHYPSIAGLPVQLAPGNPVVNYWFPLMTPLFRFRIVTLANKDTVEAKLWDDVALGAQFTIAKRWNVRPSLLKETIDGVQLTYSAYVNDNQRTASDGVNNETELVYPRYIAGDVNKISDTIWARLSLNGTGVAGVFWLEDSPRVWAKPSV